MSMHSTSLPTSAKQTPVTSPTYPVPMTVSFIRPAAESYRREPILPARSRAAGSPIITGGYLSLPWIKSEARHEQTMTIASVDRGKPVPPETAGAAGARAAGSAAALSLVSIVIPVLNEGANLRELIDRVEAALRPTQRPFELFLVDDGSTDDSRSVLAELARDRPWLRPLLLIRNYGQSTALQAGFDHVRGDVVVTLDGDLQNEPAEIPRLLELLDANRSIDVVSGWRKQRQDHTWSRKLPSWVANRLISAVDRVTLADYIGGLVVYRCPMLSNV